MKKEKEIDKVWGAVEELELAVRFPVCSKGRWVLWSFWITQPSLASPRCLEAESSAETFHLRAAAWLWKKSTDIWGESRRVVKRIADRGEYKKSDRSRGFSSCPESDVFAKGKINCTELFRSILCTISFRETQRKNFTLFLKIFGV